MPVAMEQRCFVGNFEFEHRLAHGPGWQQSQPLRRLNAELASCWLTIANEQDILVTDETIPEDFLQQLRGCGFSTPRCLTPRQLQAAAPSLGNSLRLTPWGWDHAIEQLARATGLSLVGPPLDVVRQVNSRRFSWECECDLGVALPGSVMLTSLRDAETKLSQVCDDQMKWVIKAEYGMSGRERVIGRGSILTPSVAAWISKRVNQGFAVFFEPWLPAVEEVGLQFEIDPTGRIQFLGGLTLLSDIAGQYCGSYVPSARIAEDCRFDLPDSDELSDKMLEAAMRRVSPERWRPAIRTACHVARRVHQAGYFGPLGIDAMRYRRGDEGWAWRPIQDVNARWTMGRLALGMANRLSGEEVSAWLHVGWQHAGAMSAEAWLADCRRNIDSRVRVIATSPAQLGGQPTRHGTLLLAACESELLKNAVRTCCSRSETG